MDVDAMNVARQKMTTNESDETAITLRPVNEALIKYFYAIIFDQHGNKIWEGPINVDEHASVKKENELIVSTCDLTEKGQGRSVRDESKVTEVQFLVTITGTEVPKDWENQTEIILRRELERSFKSHVTVHKVGRSRRTNDDDGGGF